MRINQAKVREIMKILLAEQKVPSTNRKGGKQSVLLQQVAISDKIFMKKYLYEV